MKQEPTRVDSPELIREAVQKIYRADSRSVLATLIRLLGDFDLAEEALQDAFRAALEQWPRDGMPNNPRAWLISTGRFKAIDTLRKSSRLEPLPDDLERRLASDSGNPAAEEHETLEDDRLRLIFTCCHPAIAAEAQVAMTLREVCGLTTEEVARAFLVAPSTVAQRIVRAKAKIRNAKIPYAIPSKGELPDRLDAVLQVIYLVFNEGYSASSGASLTRQDLSAEAIRLARLLTDLIAEPEALGLLGLMLLQESRRATRVSPEGEIVLLEEQDRSRWDRELINEGLALVDRALIAPQVGVYTLQAAIAAVHANAKTPAVTEWGRIVALYDLLMRASPSPVIELNRAVAIAMRDGPAAGLVLIEAILQRGDLGNYHLAHAAKADLCRRLGRNNEARMAYQRALAFAQQEPERRFLEKRLAELARK